MRHLGFDLRRTAPYLRPPFLPTRAVLGRPVDGRRLRCGRIVGDAPSSTPAPFRCSAAQRGCSSGSSRPGSSSRSGRGVAPRRRRTSRPRRRRPSRRPPPARSVGRLSHRRRRAVAARPARPAPGRRRRRRRPRRRRRHRARHPGRRDLHRRQRHRAAAQPGPRAGAGRLEDPLAVSVDDEGGRVQRIDGLDGPLPSARRMAARNTPEQVRDLAQARGKALVARGVTIDFAPPSSTSASSRRTP